ncbi:hypothetical protein OAB57_00165 [Bacteriovoracaceae bacterium]|nr:hypothetical protein [Bacteriovoracaceae bacterium]
MAKKIPENDRKKEAIEFFKGKKVLVLDPKGTDATNVQKIVTPLNVPTRHIFSAISYDDALEKTEVENISVVITNYNIDEQNTAIDFYTQFVNIRNNRLSSLFIVISDKNSFAISAKVLDYDIDLFIIKPYDLNFIQNEILNSIYRKRRPSAYSQFIESGKEQLIKKNYAGAIDFFELATNKSKDPALAYFYLAKSYQELQEPVEKYLPLYEEALKSNPIHYLTLMKLSDVYFTLKKYAESYRINTLLLQNYPLNPERIPDLIKLSIMNKKYEDAIKFCEIFGGLNEKNVDLQNCVAAGLALGGKYMITEGNIEKGVEALKMAGVICEGKKEILVVVIITLANVGEVDHAENVFQETGENLKKSRELRVLRLILDDKKDTESESILANGNILLNDGIKDPMVYEIMIKRCLSIETAKDQVDDYIHKATTSFPKQRDRFLKLKAG